MRRLRVALALCLAVAVTLAALAIAQGHEDRAVSVHVGVQRLPGGRLLEVSGSEGRDGACLLQSVGRGAQTEACGLGRPGRDELRTIESYDPDVTVLILYAGNGVRSVRVGGPTFEPEVLRLHPARGARRSKWFRGLRFGVVVRRGHERPRLVAVGRSGKPLGAP